MQNPLLIFVNLARFDPDDQMRLSRIGIIDDGTWEPIQSDRVYAMILLSDEETFEQLVFYHDGGQPVFGVEHKNHPVTNGLPQLRAIAPNYEKTCYFSHVPKDPIFERVRALLEAENEVERQPLVEELVDYVQLQNRWFAITTFVMNEQIRALGGIPLPIDELPTAAQDMSDFMGDGYSFEETLTKFGQRPSLGN